MNRRNNFTKRAKAVAEEKLRCLPLVNKDVSKRHAVTSFALVDTLSCDLFMSAW